MEHQKKKLGEFIQKEGLKSPGAQLPPPSSPSPCQELNGNTIQTSVVCIKSIRVQRIKLAGIKWSKVKFKVHSCCEFDLKPKR